MRPMQRGGGGGEEGTDEDGEANKAAVAVLVSLLFLFVLSPTFCVVYWMTACCWYLCR